MSNSFSCDAIVLALEETNCELDGFFKTIPNHINKIICVSPAAQIRKSNDPRVIFTEDENAGPEAAINVGLKLVSADFVTLLFPGDTVTLFEDDMPTKRNHLVYNQMFSVDGEGISRPRFDKIALINFCMPQVNLIGAYIPVMQLKLVGGFPTKHLVANDHELLLRLIKAKVTLRKAGKQQTFFRKGGISTKNFEVGMAESALIRGLPYSIIGIIIGAGLVIKNSGSVIKFIKAAWSVK